MAPSLLTVPPMMKPNGEHNHEKEGKVVVITGASAGVGRAVARAFGQERAKVALLARGTDGLEAARNEIEEMGGEALVIPTDVAEEDQVDAAAKLTEETFGPIDIWVNGAMVTVFSPVREMTGAEFKRVTEVNYLGYVYGTLAALKRMLPRDRGTIVQIGSALGFRSIPLQSAYCATKHAVVGFNEALRTELIHDGSSVDVTMVHLPAVNTPQFTWAKSKMPRRAQPVPPIFQPEVVADAILYAAHHPKRRDYTVGASALKAIVGGKVAPGLADRYLARTGYESQMLDEPSEPHAPHNLWHPLPGDHGAHGPFDDRAKEISVQAQLDRHRSTLLTALAVTALATTFAIARRRART